MNRYQVNSFAFFFELASACRYLPDTELLPELLRSTQVVLVGAALCAFILVGLVFRPLIAAEHQRRLTVDADMLLLPPLAMVVASAVVAAIIGPVIRRRHKRGSIEQTPGTDK